MTTSKVVEVKSTKEWKGDKGTVWYFTMAMENSDVVNIGKKSQDAFKVGDKIDYDVVSTDEYGVKKIKEVKEEWKGGGGYQKNYKADAVSFALSYAKDLHQADPKVDLEKMADKMYLWMLQKYNALGL